MVCSTGTNSGGVLFLSFFFVHYDLLAAHSRYIPSPPTAVVVALFTATSLMAPVILPPSPPASTTPAVCSFFEDEDNAAPG